MQIHELTKRRKPVDEGILSGIKDAFTAAKTGFQQGASAGTKSPKVAGAAGALGALTSPMAGAVASNQNALNAADKSRQAINKKLGLTGDNAIQGAKRGAGDVSAASTQNKQAQASQQQVQKQVQTMTQTFVKTPEFADLSLVLPDAGKMLMVQTKNGGQYFKDDKGVWYAEAESPAVPPKQVPPQQTKPLDALISADQYKQVASIVGGVPAATKDKKSAPNIQGGSELQKAQAAGSAARQAVGDNRSELQIAAEPNSIVNRQLATDPTLKEAAGGFNRRAIAIKQAKDLVAKNVIPLATKNKVNPSQIASDPSTKKALDNLNKLSQATVSKIKSRKDKKQRMKQAFTKYATAALTSAQGTADQSQDSATAATGKQGVNDPLAQTQAVHTLKQKGFTDTQIQAAQTQPEVSRALKTLSPLSVTEHKEIQLIEQKLKEGLLDFFQSTDTKTPTKEKPTTVDEPELSHEYQQYSNKIYKQLKGDARITWDLDERITNAQRIQLIDAYKSGQISISGLADALDKLTVSSDADKRMANSAERIDKKTEINKISQVLADKNPKAFKKWNKMEFDRKVAWLDWPIEDIIHLLDPPKYDPPKQPSLSQQAADAANTDAMKHRNQQYAAQNHNAQVQDVFNQLQNAKIYNTGQQAYLQDRLKALMAMKENSSNNKNSLTESQVAITKDIVVKTAKWQLCKKSSDQQWYDPNGTIN
jgi:hypothetical protein